MFGKELQGSIESAAGAMQTADALIITAGAGMGVDSGLPDYRGNEGLWRAYPRLKHLGLSFEEAANPSWFARDPKLAWAFYGHRQALYRQTNPHRGYALLREWGEEKVNGFFTYTSNVDGHFQYAGYDSRHLVECHGNIHHYQCSGPCGEHIWQDSTEDLDIDLEKFEALGPLPRCPECGEIARPNVLMFDDWDWIASFRIEQERRLKNWLDALQARKASVAIVELGAGKSLATIRNVSEHLARQLEGRLVRINPRDADGPKGSISIALPGLEALEQIERSMSK